MNLINLKFFSAPRFNFFFAAALIWHSIMLWGVKKSCSDLREVRIPLYFIMIILPLVFMMTTKYIRAWHISYEIFSFFSSFPRGTRKTPLPALAQLPRTNVVKATFIQGTIFSHLLSPQEIFNFHPQLLSRESIRYFLLSHLERELLLPLYYSNQMVLNHHDIHFHLLFSSLSSSSDEWWLLAVISKCIKA